MPPVVNMTHQFNTKLSRGDERRFIAWANSNGKNKDVRNANLFKIDKNWQLSIK